MKQLFALVLLCGVALGEALGVAFGQVDFSTAPLIPWNDQPANMVIMSGPPYRAIVTISMKDGSVTLGEGVTTDEAARAFWDNVTKMFPAQCRDVVTPPGPR